ncbi:MAG TPA: Smr/MutS family protein [Chitinophagaceae bacterium]|nr:Smr/MutS family protein [Chitinophagaceae bacterium]
MKFQPGDKVVVLHSNEEGEVIDIINDTMVMVEVRGVKFPAYMDQLDFPYFKRFSEKKLVQEKKEKKYIDQIPKEKTVSGSNLPEGVWLLFLPQFMKDEFDDELVQLLKVHLINGTDAGYHFHLTLNYQGEPAFELKNQLFPRQDFYLTDIPFENINDSPSFDVEFNLLNPDKRKAEFYETMLKLKPKQVFTKIEDIKKKGDPTFSYQLFNTYPDKIHEEKLDFSKLSASGFKVYEASQFRQYIAPARDTIDLHIEHITDNWEKLDNFGILTLQLAEFEKYYELAVLHRQAYLTVIHGIGSGRLKEEIHTLLKGRKEVRSFENKYHPSHGYGATVISFNY